jgi:hypothetical protein
MLKYCGLLMLVKGPQTTVRNLESHVIVGGSGLLIPAGYNSYLPIRVRYLGYPGICGYTGTDMRWVGQRFFGKNSCTRRIQPVYPPPSVSVPVYPAVRTRLCPPACELLF